MPEISKSLTCLYCDKTFNSRATASRHRAICKIQTEKQKQELEEQKKIENEKEEELRRFQFQKYDLLQEQFNQQNKRIQELENTVMEQNKQIENNKKLEVIVMEQKKDIDFLKNMVLELVKKPVTFESQPVQQTQPVQPVQEPVKKSFSIRTYLNEECKKALTVNQLCERFTQYLKTYDVKNLSNDPNELYKFVIDRALKELNRDELPLRCSSAKLKTFWEKKEDGEWVKGVDIGNIYKKHLCEPLWEYVKNYMVNINPRWKDDDVYQDKINGFNTAFCKACYEEEYQKKAIQYLISKTMIDKSN